IGLDRRRAAFALEPPLGAVLLDHRRERLVECAVVLYIELLVRELVEQQARDVARAAADHRAQHRIGEVAERRVRARAADVGIEPLALERLAKALGLVALEEAAIGDATREREAPARRRHG